MSLSTAHLEKKLMLILLGVTLTKMAIYLVLVLKYSKYFYLYFTCFLVVSWHVLVFHYILVFFSLYNSKGRLGTGSNQDFYFVLGHQS